MTEVAQERSDPLLERDMELAVLRTALSEAACDNGNVVLVEGPAGVGKSRLLAAAREAARERRFRVLHARGSDLERDAALGVALQLLAPQIAGAPPAQRRRLFDGVAGCAAPLFGAAGALPHDPEALYQGLFWLVVNLLALPFPASSPGLLLSLDDLQVADEASLRFLVYLATHLDGLPIVLLGATRSGEPEAPRQLLNRLRTAPNVQPITPAPLSERAVATLVRRSFPTATPVFAAACREVTGGNPFLLTELLRALPSEGIATSEQGAEQVRRLVPESVLRSVLVRLARLSPEAERLAEAAAVLGSGTMRHAARLARLELPQAEQAADALATAGVLEPGSPLRFTHPLIGAAVLADLPAFRRARAHRQAADLLAAAGAAPEVVAGHLLCAEPDHDPEVVRTLRSAAARARRRGDPAAAARLLSRALEEPPPLEARAEVLVELAQAEITAGLSTAAGHIAEALQQITAPPARAKALLVLGQLRRAQADPLGALAAIEDALALLGDEDPAKGPLIAEFLTVAAFHTKLRPRADKLIAPILAASRAGDLSAHPAVMAHVALWLALQGEPPALVRRVSERALAADPLVEPSSHGALLGFVVRALVSVDELALADDAATAALEATRRSGAVFGHAFAGYHRALARFSRGALAEALADLTSAAAPAELGWRAQDGWIGELLCRVYVAGGDVDAARDALRRTEDVEPTALTFAFVLQARAQLAWADSDPASALRDAQAAGEHLATYFGLDHPGLLAWRDTAAPAAAATGDTALAVRLANEGLSLARSCAVPRVIGSALHVAGLVSGANNGVALLTEAVEVLERSPAVLEHASALVGLGAALRRTGSRVEARAPLLRGLEVAESMGALPLADRARQELLASGSRPRRSALSGPAALTPSELRVAELAAAGHTNTVIAHKLSVSGKTVETHLRHAYRKLGVSRRGQLTVALRL